MTSWTSFRATCTTKVEMKTHPTKDQRASEQTALTAEIGGAVAFVWDIESIEKFLRVSHEPEF
jgi:hypothetical protein